MSFELRGRLVSFDNLVVGSASGRERTIAGATPSTEAPLGGTGSSTDPGGGTSAVGALHVSRIELAVGVQTTSDPPSNYVVVGTRTLPREIIG